MVKSQEHSCAKYKKGDIITVSYEAQLWKKKKRCNIEIRLINDGMTYFTRQCLFFFLSDTKITGHPLTDGITDMMKYNILGG